MPTAVITGAGSGIGLETITAFLNTESNTEVIAIVHSEADIVKLNQKFAQNSQLQVLCWDIVSGDSSIIKQIIGSKTVDILINNAGFLVNKPFTELSYADFLQAWEVNCWGSARVIQLLLPNLLQASHPHIIMIGSMGGISGSVKFSGLAAYSSAKGALTILTESLHYEYLQTNLTFNCLCFGAVQTKMLTKAFSDYQAPLRDSEAGLFVANFAQTGYRYFRGKIIPVSTTTP